MKAGSLPELSQDAKAVLFAEREIVPQPELVRRRAQLRARTARWQERSQGREAGGMSPFWRRLSLVAAVALFATSGLAAWVTLTPDRDEENSTVPDGSRSRSGPAKLPVSKAPTLVLPEDERLPAGQGERTAGTAPKAAGRGDHPKRPPSVSKSATPKEGTTLPEELTLLDRARRAVAGGNYRKALTLIDQHRGKFPKSELREEREALRVRGLEGAGLAKQAGQAASEFESRYPRSVLAPQMNESGRTSP